MPAGQLGCYRCLGEDLHFEAERGLSDAGSVWYEAGPGTLQEGAPGVSGANVASDGVGGLGANPDDKRSMRRTTGGRCGGCLAKASTMLGIILVVVLILVLTGRL